MCVKTKTIYVDRWHHLVVLLHTDTAVASGWWHCGLSARLVTVLRCRKQSRHWQLATPHDTSLPSNWYHTNTH